VNAVVIAWAMMGAACLTLALVHGGIWLQQRNERAYLYFAIFALAIVGFGFVELRLMIADDVATYARVQPWTLLPLLFAAVGIVGFVWHYFGTGRAWLAAAGLALRALVTAVNFWLPGGINFERIDALVPVHLLGEVVSAAKGTTTAWTHLGQFGWFVLFVFVADAAWTLWRRGDPVRRWRAVWVGGSILLLIAIGVMLSGLIHSGLVQSPYLVMPMFLVVLSTMGYGLTLDVVRAAKLEREAAQHRLELAHLSRIGMLGELSGSIAHELNQPLASILSNAQAAQLLLARDDLDIAQLRAILADIVDDDRRAGEVIRRLRALLRKEPLPFQRLDVNEVVRDVLRIMRNDLLGRGVAARTELAGSLPAVEGDRVQLQQVLLNLLINACEAMGAGASERVVRVRTSAGADGGVEVAVRDSGPGIAPGESTRIFDAFVTTKADGTGLGLAVCRTIVEAHGGRISARNNPEGGATVGFTLPAAGQAA
jgi:signal transduction histidine kinase